jgi:hypothetical protein
MLPIKKCWVAIFVLLMSGAGQISSEASPRPDAQEHSAPICQLAIALVVSPSNNSDAVLRLTLTNVSSHPFQFCVTGVTRDFIFKVFDSQGHEAPLTKYGKELLAPAPAPGSDLSLAGLSFRTMTVHIELLPGNSDVSSVAINSLFDMRTSGNYRVMAIMNYQGEDNFLPVTGTTDPPSKETGAFTVTSNTISIKKDQAGYSLAESPEPSDGSGTAWHEKPAPLGIISTGGE